MGADTFTQTENSYFIEHQEAAAVKIHVLRFKERENCSAFIKVGQM